MLERQGCRRAATVIAIMMLLMLGVFGRAPASAFAPTALELRVAERSAGNRKADAENLARVLLATTWPVQVLRVKVDGIDRHEIAGIVLEGEDFHGPVDWLTFRAEVVSLVQATFVHSGVDEVDIWATVPIRVEPGTVVSGDYAMPTTRTVFSVSVERAESADIGLRLAQTKGVYVDPMWRALTFGV
ncbi:MAG: hypothetical protein ACREM8_07240 [Vulcanimicrobiaceae bacterium]